MNRALTKLYRNEDSTIAITNSHKLYVSGDNTDFKDRLRGTLDEPVLLELDGALLASAGVHNSHHTFVYSVGDKLFASGSNRDGQFGNGVVDKRETQSLLQVPRFWTAQERIIDIQCVYRHSVFLTDQQIAYQTGNGSVEQTLIYSYAQQKIEMKGVSRITCITL